MAIELKTKKALDLLAPYKSAEDNLQNYIAQRSEFETGDLLFFSGDHWVSRLIRWRSKSAWSHIGMVVKIEEMNRLFLVESTMENGVRLLPLSFLFTDYGGDSKSYSGRVAWAKHSNLDNQKDKINLLKAFCLDNLTKQYDRREYWRIVYRSVLGMKKLFKDDKYTCAEYIYEAYKYAKTPLPREKGVFISPGSFWRQKEVYLKDILI